MGWSAAIAGAGAAFNLLGSISQGNAQAAYADYAAQVARNNQIIANRNAAYATQAGETSAALHGEQERVKMGATRAALSASGIDVNTGSAADVRASQRLLAEADVRQVRENAALRAYGYRSQATSYGAEAQLKTAEAGYDVTSGWLKGLGGLLGAAPSLPNPFGSSSAADSDTAASSYQGWSPA